MPSSDQNDRVNYLLRLFTEFEVGSEDFAHLDSNPQVDNNQDPEEKNLNWDSNQTPKYNEDSNNQDKNNGLIFKPEWDNDNYNPYSDDIISSNNKLNEFEKVEEHFDDAVYQNIQEDDMNCENSSTKEKCNIM